MSNVLLVGKAHVHCTCGVELENDAIAICVSLQAPILWRTELCMVESVWAWFKWPQPKEREYIL